MRISTLCSVLFLNNDLFPVILSDLTGKFATLPIKKIFEMFSISNEATCVWDLQRRCSPRCTSSPGR